MSEWRLREPTQPCEHIGDHPGAYPSRKVWKCEVAGCPGGREIVLPDFLANGVKEWEFVAGPEETMEQVALYKVWVEEVDGDE